MDCGEQRIWIEEVKLLSWLQKRLAEGVNTNGGVLGENFDVSK